MMLKSKFSLIAPCGMNCGICSVYLREKNKCPECRLDDTNKPITRAGCKIKNCDLFQNGKAKFCFQCDDFPCANLKHLDTRYRAKYKMSMIENLEYIEKHGIRKFVASEKVRWSCPECEGTINVHKGICNICGTKKL
jgi:hypothetical protein